MSDERVPCPGCEKPLNPRFAVCPFCGEQVRERAEVRPTSLDAPDSGPSMPAQAKVAIATSPLGRTADEERVTGAFSGVKVALLPSRHARGWLRYVDIGLTVFAIPFVLASMAGILFQGVKRWGKIGALEWVFGLAFGAPLLGLVLYLAFGASFSTVMTVVGSSFAAWAGRGVLRWFAQAARLSDNA